MAIDYRNSLARYRKYLQAAQTKPMWRATLFVTLSLSLLIILLMFALRPTLVIIAELLGKIKTETQVLAQLDDKISVMQGLIQKYQSIQPQMHLLDSGLPIQSQYALWGKYLENAGLISGSKASNITLTNINLSKSTANSEGLTEIGFSMTAQGTYDQVRDLISLIEKSRRISNISDVQISKSTDGSLIANIKGNVYFILENYQP